MIPWILFRTILPSQGGAEQHLLMSDILFLSVKEHAGKLRENEGGRSTTGDLATLTANTGKDMYLAKAKFTASNTSTTLQSNTVIVELKVNGIVHETANIELVTTASSEGPITRDYQFVTSGVKVAASQIIKLEVITIDSANITVEGVITCFEEATGESPFQSTEFS